MLFQPSRITIPGDGQDSQSLVGMLGSMEVILKRTDYGLEVATPLASAMVPEETSKAVAKTAEQLINHLERWHPELLSACIRTC